MRNKNWSIVPALAVLLALAGCGPHYIPIPGALPTSLSSAEDACKVRTFEVDPECMKSRGWMRDNDETTRASIRPWAPDAPIVVSGVTIGGLSPLQISDDQVHCLRNVARWTQFRPILLHIPDPYTGLYNDEEVTNEGIPTAAEAGLLAAYSSEADRCDWHMLTAIDHAAPRFSPILHQRWIESKLIMVKLILQQISFGDAARRQHASIQKAKDAILKASR